MESTSNVYTKGGHGWGETIWTSRAVDTHFVTVAMVEQVKRKNKRGKKFSFFFGQNV